MSKQTERIERELKGAAEKVIRRYQLRAWQVLAVETPINFGTARSGWTPSTGSPVDTAVTAPADETAARAAAAARLATNKARAEAIAASYKIEQGRAFLTNAVPWIVPLNAGSSAQAPSNFVPLALNKAFRSLPRTLGSS